MLRRVLLNWRNPLTYTTKRYFLNQPKFDTNKDYYSILQVKTTATDAEIKQAFYRMAKDCHPDHHQGKQAQFKQINEAYQILSDASQRSKYDMIYGIIQVQKGDSFDDFKKRFDEMSPEQQEKVGKNARKTLGVVAYVSYSMLAWVFRSIKNLFTSQKQQQPIEQSADDNIEQKNAQIKKQTEQQKLSGEKNKIIGQQKPQNSKQQGNPSKTQDKSKMVEQKQQKQQTVAPVLQKTVDSATENQQKNQQIISSPKQQQESQKQTHKQNISVADSVQNLESNKNEQKNEDK